MNDNDRFAGLGVSALSMTERESVVKLACAVLASELHQGPLMSDNRAAATHLQLKTARYEREAFGCLFLNARNRLIGDEELFQGSIDRNNVYPRRSPPLQQDPSSCSGSICRRSRKRSCQAVGAGWCATVIFRNGRFLTGIGAVDVRVPKARSRSGSAEPFRSALVPPYLRRSASVDAAVPWLYLHGVSTGQMRPAVAALVGEEAARGLSANVVSRLKRVWDEEYRDWCRRDLSDDRVYVWADGIHSGLRGDDGRLCVLVVIGVNARGDKHFLAIEDGVRESTQSWREVLLG